MGMIKEFKEFALGGSLVDMAVGIVMGGAIGGLVKAMIDNLISPVIGLFAGGVDFATMGAKIGQNEATGEPLMLQYGAFINALIQFLVLAFVIFVMVKMVNSARKSMGMAAPGDGPTDIDLLTEIRDSLKK